MYVINPKNVNLDYLLLDGDQRLITRQQIYRIYDDNVERFNNGPIVDVYMNRM